MTTTINASTGVSDSTGGIVITGDLSGVLALQADYTTLVTLSSGVVAVSGGLTAVSATISGPASITGTLAAGASTISGTLSVTGDTTLSSTGALTVPRGTTAQQPGTPVNGMFRYNTEDARFEGYADSAWGAIGGAGGSSSITSAKLYFFAGI